MALIPFDDRDGEIWMDGAFRPWRDATLHVLSHALHYGSCVFEGERAYGGKIFKLREHTDRLLFSARELGFEIPFDADTIDAACQETLQRNGLKDAYVRPVAWRGSENMGVNAQQATIHVAIAAWTWPNLFSEEERLRGVRLMMSRWRRPAPNTIPCHAKAAGLYMICTLSKHECEAQGFQDSLMLDHRGYVAEATGANVFFAREGELHTPTADCFLDGITRRTVIDLARKRGITLHERHIEPEELLTFEECFLTGTAAEVTPVQSIGDHLYPGREISSVLMRDFDALVRV